MAVSSSVGGQSPAPHVDKADGRDREVNRGGRCEGTGRGGNLEEIGHIRRGKLWRGS